MLFQKFCYLQTKKQLLQKHLWISVFSKMFSLWCAQAVIAVKRVKNDWNDFHVFHGSSQTSFQLFAILPYTAILKLFVIRCLPALFNVFPTNNLCFSMFLSQMELQWNWRTKMVAHSFTGPRLVDTPPSASLWWSKAWNQTQKIIWGEWF